jgi:hypothetical protein
VSTILPFGRLQSYAAATLQIPSTKRHGDVSDELTAQQRYGRLLCPGYFPSCLERSCHCHPAEVILRFKCLWRKHCLSREGKLGRSRSAIKRHQPQAQIEQYSQLLAQAQRLLSDIHATYTCPDATDPVNITETISKALASAINTASNVTFPAMQDMFTPAQKHVEGLIQDDIYPRFVKHQLMASASMALAHDQMTYQGLGDCFCLTDPK